MRESSFSESAQVTDYLCISCLQVLNPHNLDTVCLSFAQQNDNHCAAIPIMGVRVLFLYVDSILQLLIVAGDGFVINCCCCSVPFPSNPTPLIKTIRTLIYPSVLKYSDIAIPITDIFVVSLMIFANIIFLLTYRSLNSYRTIKVTKN